MAARRTPATAGSTSERRDGAWKFSNHRSTLWNMGESERKTDARIAVSTETRNKVRSKKRGGETYDDLLQRMADQYDPEEDPTQN